MHHTVPNPANQTYAGDLDAVAAGDSRSCAMGVWKALSQPCMLLSFAMQLALWSTCNMAAPVQETMTPWLLGISRS